PPHSTLFPYPTLFRSGHFSSGIKELLHGADIRVANCERQYSDRAAANARTKHGCQPTAMAAIFPEFGFDVLTLANNHMMDAGPQDRKSTRLNSSHVKI